MSDQATTINGQDDPLPPGFTLDGPPPAVSAAAYPLPMPPVYGKAPTSMTQIVPNLGDKASHFTGPVVSGPPGPPLGAANVQGAALFAFSFYVDYSMGGFSLPVQFPPNSILLWMITTTYAAFTGGTGGPTVALGSAASGTDILAATTVTATAKGKSTTAITGCLPLPTDPAPGQAFVTVVGNGNTAGGAIISLIYLRPGRSWN